MPDPFLYPSPYSPGQMAFNNNAELSQLVTMFGGPLLGAMAGPGNFMPHMVPGQALMDQFAMRNYQNQTRQATFSLANAGPQNDEVAQRLLGMRSAFTGKAPTDMNREQATNMAQMLNNPLTKTFAGMMIGPENVESLLHGSRGDIQSLGSTVNRLGYFRKDPNGNDRMGAESLEDLTTGVFSHLYEPQGDLDKLGKTARAGGDAGAEATRRLQKAANMEDRRVVTDADVQSRLENTGATNVESLYKKYVQGGTATDTATQAKELTRFDRAIKESKVLGTEEATVGQLETAAFKQPTAEMHGLTAGQASQLMENLFQRGALPPGVGNLSAKDKVGAIAETKLDEATLDRLAETMARRQLQEKNEVGAGGKRFSDMTSTEQQEEIKKVSTAPGGLRDQINATKAEADKFAAGTSDKSVEDIMQMTGGSALAGNVDASRTSSRLKEYADSVAAVRDIFGDNGNPNAPMPALMAALDHLTQGAMGSMNPAQMSTTLRQMQTMARETGTGMQQMAAISQHAGALGSQLGVAPSITMQNVAMSMGMTKTAMDRGAFNQTPGGMTKEQFQQESVERLQHGDASDNAKAMAAMRRIYESDPEKFKGTELEAAVGAYTDRSSGGNYEVDELDESGKKTGKKVKRNIFEQIGRGRHHAAKGIIGRSGGTENQFYSAVYDPRTATEEFMMSGSGFMTQKHQIVQELGDAGAGGMVVNALDDTALGDKLGEKGQIELGNTLAEMVMDSSNMGVGQQLSFLQKHMPEKIAQSFERQGMSADQAKAMSQQVVTQMFGDGKGGISKTRLDELVGNVGQAAQDIYGQNTVELNQLYGNGGDVKAMQEMAKSQAHAAATRRLVGVGSESTPMGRISDYFMDIGKRGEKFDIGNMMKEMAPFVSDKEVLQRYAGEMGAGMHTLSAMRDKVQVSDTYIDKLAKEGNVDELKKLGGVTDKEVVVDDATLKAEREKRLYGDSKMSDDDVAKEYARIRGLSGAAAGKHIPIEERRAFLANSEQFAAESEEAYLNQQHHDTGKQHLSMRGLKTRAMRSVGRALEGKEGQQEDIEAVQQAIFKGDDKEAQTAAISAVGRLFKDEAGKAGALASNEGKLKELMSADGEAGTTAILEQLGLKKEDFERNKSQKTEDKSAEQRLAEVMTAVQRSDEQQQLDKVTDDKTAKGVAQKTDKVELAAQNVYINGAKAGGTEQMPAVTPQKPGSAMPTTKDAIDAEIAAITKKESHVLYDFITDDDKKRREELIKQREAIVEQEKTAAPAAATAAPAGAAAPATTPAAAADATKPDTQKSAEPAAATPASAPATTTPSAETTPAAAKSPSEPAKAPDTPLPEAKTANTDPKTAEAVRQQNDTAAVQAVGVSKEEAKAVINAVEATPADPQRAKYEEQIALSKKRLAAAEKNPDPEIREELRQANASDIKTYEQQLRAYDVAKESGIPWSGKKDTWRTRGEGVPVSINGRDVDPATLKEDEIKSVIGAINMTATMDGKMSPADAAMLERYQKALTDKQNGVEQTKPQGIAERNEAELQQQAGLKPGEKPTVDAAEPPVEQAADAPAAEKVAAFKDDKERDAAWAKLTPEERKQVEVVRSKELLEAGRKGGHSQETLDSAYETMAHGVREIAARRAAVEAGIIGEGDEIDFKDTGSDHDVTVNGQKIEHASFKKHVEAAEKSLSDGAASFLSGDADKFMAGNEAMQKAAKQAETTEAAPQAVVTAPEQKQPPKPEEEEQLRLYREDQQTKRTEHMVNASGNRLAQHLVARQIEDEVPTAASIPKEKTADIQQASETGTLGSANIHPASVNPEQQPRGGEYTGQAAAAGGCGDKGSITLNGSLRLEGLHEAILDATAQKAVATPGGGVPVVGGGSMGRGGLPSGPRVT